MAKVASKKHGFQKCPQCKGVGEQVGLFPIWADNVPKEDRKPYILLPCCLCRVTGKVIIQKTSWVTNGLILKKRRLDKKFTLRSACKYLRMPASKLSDMENGYIEPDLSIIYETIKIIKQ